MYYGVWARFNSSIICVRIRKAAGQLLHSGWDGSSDGLALTIIADRFLFGN